MVTEPGCGSGALRRAVFLDRDGTINIEQEYLFRPEEFAFLPGVSAAIRRLNEVGLLVIVVTNQSGVARGFYGEAEVGRLHDHIRGLLAAEGAKVDAFYYCPHHPTAEVAVYRRNCNCRKGEPGMLLRAAAEYGIDLAHSFMVGDKLIDVEAGRRAGCRPILVRTGYGAQEAVRLVDPEVPVVEDLSAAVEYILSLD